MVALHPQHSFSKGIFDALNVMTLPQKGHLTLQEIYIIDLLVFEQREHVSEKQNPHHRHDSGKEWTENPCAVNREHHCHS
jgi:hypothetical protein